MAVSCLYSLPAWQKQIVNPLPEHYCPGRLGHNALCVKDELLVWGGYNDDQSGSKYCDKNALWTYNLDLDLWRKVTLKGEMPQYRSGACSAVVWPYWYIFCGHTYEGDVNDMYCINLVTLRSESVKVDGLAVSPRDKSSCWVWGSRIYVFGGYGPSPLEYSWDKTQDVFTLEFMNDRGWNNQVLCFETLTNTWMKVDCKGPKPCGRAAHSAVLLGDVVYIFGGRHQSQRRNDLHAFRMDDHSWSGAISCVGQVPEARSWHSMSRKDQTNLLLYGGFNNANVPLADVWLLDVTSYSWTQLKRSTGLPRLWHTANVNEHGDILVFGGSSGNILNEEEYETSSDIVILFRTKPFSLERLCLHKLAKERERTQNMWHELPTPLQDWLHIRRKLMDEYKPTLHKHNVESGLGPSLDALTVLSEERCRELNSKKKFVEYMFQVF